MERRKICRYFEKGSCKKDNCPFVHIRQNRKNCEFYMQGYCKKGDKCNFYHPPKEKEIVQEKQNKNAQKKNRKKPKFSQKVEKQEQYVEEQHQEKKIQKVEEQQTLFQDLNTGEEKINKINMLLGMEYSSSEQSEDFEIKEDMSLQFQKIYPKKFIDLSKTPERKERIKENQEIYFGKTKFLQLLQKLQSPEEKEHYQIIRKFQDSYKVVNQGDENEYIIKIRPLLYSNDINFHFEMVEDFFEIKINKNGYPKGLANFEILNFSIPQHYKNKIIDHLMMFHKRKTIFETLKYFINSFEKIYEKSKSKLQNEYYSQFELKKKIISENREKDEERKQAKKKKKIRTKVNIENPDVIVSRFAPNQKIDVGNMNYDITIQPIFIQNCEYVVVQRLLLFLVCKCQNQIVHVFEADRKQMRIGVKLTCRKCQNIIRLALNRQVVQVKCTLVGKLGIQNGGLLEVGGISWKFGCECDNQIIKEKVYLPGQRANINCHECFKSMNVSFIGLKHFNPFIKEFQAQDGKELINRGTCKHLKLSFRWLRYGCCGRSFSCDDCHEKGSAHEHEKISGVTMLCGFCSMQQPVAPDCIHCRKELVKGVDKGGHWEGGLGCRDQTLLSKKDVKKYSGLTKKK